MKTLQPMSVGDKVFTVTANQPDPDGSVLEVTVRHGKHSLCRKMNHQGKHDHSEEQYERDVNQFATYLAHELAGRLRGAELGKKFTTT